MGSEKPETIAIAVETSGTVGSVAFGAGGVVLGERVFDSNIRHGAALLPTLAELLRSCDLAPTDAGHIYVSAGPGSFTGLRVGISFARTYAAATGAQIVCVPSLEVIAQNALGSGHPRIAVMLDAKRNHVLAACFEHRDGAYRPVDEPNEYAPVSYATSLRPVGLIGEGVRTYWEKLNGLSGVTIIPDGEVPYAARARTVFTLGTEMAMRGAFTAARDVVPMYIRRPDAAERWEQRHGAGAERGG